MKNKKIIIIIIIAIIAIGVILSLLLCKGNSNKELLDSYNKSKKSDTVSSYTLDLRIYGLLNDGYVNKIVRINTPKEDEISITYIEDGEENQYVYKQGNFYKVKNDKLAITNSFNSYNNPEIYLDGAKNLVTSSKTKTETLGDKNYEVYKVTFKKDFINEMLENTDLNYSVKKDIDGVIWLDQDSRVYRVYYNNIDKLTIFASYYAYNMGKTE